MKIVFGTYKIENETQLKELIEYSISKGIKRIDTAQLYKNEGIIGDISKDSDISISTKISKFDHLEYVNNRIDYIFNTFKDKLTHIMLHNPTEIVYNKLLYKRCKEKNVQYGVSNATFKYLELLSVFEIVPDFIQIEFHPFLNFAILSKLMNYCKEKGIKIQGHTILAKGKLLYFTPLVNMAKKYNISVAQLMIKWASMYDIDLILSSKNKLHIDEWIDQKIQNVVLNDNDIAEINGYYITEPHIYYQSPILYTTIDFPIQLDSYIEMVIENLKNDLSKLNSTSGSSDDKSQRNSVELLSDTIIHFTKMSRSSLVNQWKDYKLYKKLVDTFCDDKPEYNVSQKADITFSVIKKLRFAHSQQYYTKLKKKAKSKQTCNLKSQHYIHNPEAMPVQISDVQIFKPFIDYLSTDEIPKTSKQFIKGVFYPDCRMDLCKQGVGYNTIEPLCDAIYKSGKVKHFLFGNNIAFGVKESATKIAELIKNSKIETWYLAGNNIGGSSVQIISESLHNNQYAEALWLKRNPIHTSSLQLKQMLNNNNKLVLLDLHNTGLGNNGLLQLFKGLKNTTLKHIYLDANDISNVDPITEYINNGYSQLESIYISMNPLVKNEKSLNKFLSSMKNNQYIKRLCFSSCGLNDSFEFDLLDIPNLCMLDFGMYKATNDLGLEINKFTDLSKDAIIRFINRHPKLQYINFYSSYDNEELIDIKEDLSVFLTTKKKTIHTNDYIQRELKHPQMVVNIDSVYRGK